MTPAEATGRRFDLDSYHSGGAPAAHDRDLSTADGGLLAHRSNAHYSANLGDSRHGRGTITFRGRIMRAWLTIAPMLVLAIVAAAPATANQGDKAGWSFVTDQQKRAVLIFVPTKDGPRSLTIGCLRASEIFEVLVEDVAKARTPVTGVALTLTNGQARFEARGEIGFFASTKSFDSNAIADAATLRRIRDTLVPVLEGPGPIVLTLGSLTRELPVAGLADALKHFKPACFGS
jgi:hypothetical protein